MHNENVTPATTVVFPAGGVQYSLEDAAIDIEEMIEVLQQAQRDGATHVAFTSGNHRGASWQRFYYESAEMAFEDEY